MASEEKDPVTVGESWLAALVARDFERLAALCKPEASGRLMIPSRIVTTDGATETVERIAAWFKDCEVIRDEGSHVSMVGTQLAIHIRVYVEEMGEAFAVEQQLYCAVEGGQIERLSLLCSGFQPLDRSDDDPASEIHPARALATQPDAFLRMDDAITAGSTCAVLTPAIKRKLGELQSGQVLEVHVNDPTARGDIEAWSRLSGNSLLRIDEAEGGELTFLVRKK